LIASRTEFDKTDSVLEYVAKGKWRDSYKANLCDFYNQYCKFYGIVFFKPKYAKVNRIPRVPTEDMINLIFRHASQKYVIIDKLEENLARSMKGLLLLPRFRL